jgi:nucleotide-binding universal stress UspA family protein
MKTTSYLIVLDGSAESLAAAHTAWSLAAETGARVDAQYVVDTDAIWRFLSFERPGLVGSGVFIEARDKITAVMTALAETVMLSFRTQMEGRCVEFETFIDKGVPEDEVAARAAHYDLAICAYHAPSTHGSGGAHSLAEKLAEKCSCPVLAVRSLAYGWSKLELFLTGGLANDAAIKEIYSMAAWMGMSAEVILSPETMKVDPDTYMLGGWSRAFGVDMVRSGSLKDLIDKAADDSILVVGAEQLSGHCDEPRRELVREYLEASEKRAVLFWPDPARIKKSLVAAH